MTRVFGNGRFGSTTNVVLINFVACIVIFCQAIEFAETPVGTIKLEYFLTFPLFMNLIFILRGLYLDARFILCLLVLAGTTTWKVIEGANDVSQMVKILIGLFQNGALFYMVLKANSFKVGQIFNTYLAIAVPVAFFGLLQEVAWVIGLTPIYDLSWIFPTYVPGTPSGVFMRTHSILPEPASFVFTLVPAVFASLHSWVEPARRLVTARQSIILVSAYLFSFSSVGYIGLCIMMLVLIINLRKFMYLLAVVLLLPIFALTAYFVVPDVKFRADNSIALASGESEWIDADLSNLALLVNAHVAAASFRESPLVGSGLGSHPVSYKRFISDIIDVQSFSEANKILTNQQDAASMMLRLISETGLVGVSMMLIFLFGCRLAKRNDPTNTLWVINNGVFCLFMLALFRFGNYFALGTFLFFWMLYASKREALSLRTSLSKVERIDLENVPRDRPAIG